MRFLFGSSRLWFLSMLAGLVLIVFAKRRYRIGRRLGISLALMFVGGQIYYAVSKPYFRYLRDRPVSFEEHAYGYLAMMVALAVFLLGLVILTWPDRRRRPSIDDPSTPPGEDSGTRFTGSE